MKTRRAILGLIVAAGVLLPAAFPVVEASATCDTTSGSADAIQLEAAHAAIDAACPCDGLPSRGDYRRCAKSAIDALVEASNLTSDCKRQARDYAYLSRCGTPGAVVCCRVDSNGRPKHRVLRDAARCVSTSSITQCLAQTKSVVTGCDDRGCIAWCGNGIVDAEEDCEPPGTGTCGLDCRACTPVASGTCGNLVLDPGETCEPPGAGSCDPSCHTAGCQAAGPGEIDVACIDGNTEVTAAASSGGYLFAWSGVFRTGMTDILSRRFDASGVPLDPAVRIVSEERTCGSENNSPSAGSDGNDYYVTWAGRTSIPDTVGVFEESLTGRRIGGNGGAQTTDTIATNIPFGTCRGSIGGPTATSGAGASRFSVSWRSSQSCYGNPMFIDPQGSFLEFNPDLVKTGAPIGYPLPTGYPATGSTGVATVASLSGATLWSWHAGGAASAEGPFVRFVAAAWSDGASTSAPAPLSSRQNVPAGARPSVCAGAASFLVTWAEGATSDLATEVRAMRATRAAGPLDADGGLLLATVPGGIVTAPVAAFDGVRWFVAWTAKAGATNEIRAVSVNADGSVVDASPRLVASNVKAQVPVLASGGNGKVLVAFTREDGGRSAVRAVVMTP